MGWLNRLQGGFGPFSGRSRCRLSNSFRLRPAVTAILLSGALGLSFPALNGCGNQYRPVVTPINPTGPAAQPTAYLTVVSQPGFTPVPTTLTTPCVPNPTYPAPSIITLLDFSGDSVLAQANGGNGPLTFSLDSTGVDVFAPNCDGTLTSATASTNSLLTKNTQTSTLLPGSEPSNTLKANGNLYVAEAGLHGAPLPGEPAPCLNTNCVAELLGSPEALVQEIPVAPSLVNLAGYTISQRLYAISQGNSAQLTTPGATPLSWGACNNPAAVAAAGVTGEADAIETINNTISARLPLGVCPVYGFMTPDSFRTFIMNRGSGTVTVINSQLNALDTTNARLGPNATIPVGAGPVYADYYRTGQVLVTANYDSDSISIIDVSLDIYGNDSPTFGSVLATVPVGHHPVEATILQDGSRVYVANQGDIGTCVPGGVSTGCGSVSVVNLSDYTVEKTIPLTSNPHAIASIYNYPIGKVYVASQNSPYLTVIRTDTDVISATPEMQGNIVDIHVSSQYPAQSGQTTANYQTESRSVGSGAP